MKTLQEIAIAAHDLVLAKGAQATAVSIGESRSVQTEWRKGELERLQDKTHRSLGIEVYVDGRYAGFSTNDLRSGPLSKFLEQTVAMTRLLEPDPHRILPCPPAKSSELPLDLYDHSIMDRHAHARDEDMEGLNDAVQTTLGDLNIVSYTTSLSDGWGRYFRLFSTGFCEEACTSSFSKSATLSLKDAEGKLPLGWDGTYARHREDLLKNAQLARTMLERAQNQLNATPITTDRYDIVVVNRSMGKLLGPVLSPMRGSAIQQGR